MIDAAQASVWVAAVLAAGSAMVAWRGRRTWALAALSAASVALWLAVAALARALVQSDFSLVYVVDHSRASSSAPYRLAGLWGGMAGSLLLWAAILSTIVVAVLARHAMSRLAHIAGVGVVLGTTLIVVVAVDPFERLAIPAIRGRGLTPILDHPAMLIHPPTLYTGLLLCAAPFVLAVDAATGARALDVERVRRAVRTAAVVTGIGLVLGANWAYVELGWGGYWAWDPVENAALMPWLALLAWLHAARSSWATPRLLVALAMLPLVLVFAGAWLTRAGVSVSVHAFAEAPGVGRGFAALVVGVALAGSATVARRRGPFLRADADADADATAFPVTLAALLLAAVLLGTSYPIVRDASTGDTVTVGGTYFSRAAWPLAVAAGFGLAVLVRASSRRMAALGAVGGVGIGIAADLPWFGSLLAAAAGAAIVAAIVGFARDGRRRAIHLAHGGFALLLLGIAGTTGTTTESTLLAIGERGEFRGEEVVLDDITVDDLGAGRTAVTARLTVDGRAMAPARVAHRESDAVLAETDTRNRWTGDLQLVLRDVTDDLAVVELRFRPLAGFIWWGAGVMLLGLGLARLASSATADPPSTGERPARVDAPATSSGGVADPLARAGAGTGRAAPVPRSARGS